MTDPHARNLELQVEWYGEPLGGRFRRLLAGLQISQAQLAGILGLSAPMLSQLMSGQRAKISNPSVLSRLFQLEEAVSEPTWPALSKEEREHRLDLIRAAQVSTLTAAPPSTGTPEQTTAGATDPVEIVQSLLRNVASASELEGAAKLLDDQYPDLAEALRILGAGRTQEARTYYTRVTRHG
ncbi:hypothetical protein FB561_1961 [Kribbella amoyensis]|uniref:Helix-turn-helix protein n=1 Tax=Kribbella amoyensis TaxID=996641 RepID=A0A561BPS7_9ACTN|nr:helix-turn-helix transcriptional regulator [Kribbella amoyensis]TWD80864.1 hypothetical protein FB561_1961 [Kribbella amoyensis]